MPTFLIAAAQDIAAAFIDFYIPTDNERNNAQAKIAGAEVSLCTSRPADEVERSISDALEAWKAAC